MEETLNMLSKSCLFMILLKLKMTACGDFATVCVHRKYIYMYMAFNTSS